MRYLRCPLVIYVVLISFCVSASVEDISSSTPSSFFHSLSQSSDHLLGVKRTLPTPDEERSPVSPISFVYPYRNYELRVNQFILPIEPSIRGCITNSTIEPSLPRNLFLDPLTGIISGKPESIMGSKTFSITMTTEAGRASTELTLSVIQESVDCEATGQFPFISDGETTVIACEPDYEGYQVVQCIRGVSSVVYSTCVSRDFVFSFGVTALNLTVDVPFTPLSLVCEESTVILSTTPPLPEGVSISSAGVLSGIPRVSFPTTVITITGEFHSISLSTHILLTVKPSECHGIDGFNTTNSGEIAVSTSCPPGTTGTILRECLLGTWQSAESHCTLIPPSQLVYSVTYLTGTVGQSFFLEEPTFSGIVEFFTSDPPLPWGITLSPQGVISGIPLIASPLTVYTITANNVSGMTSCELTLTVIPASCEEIPHQGRLMLECPSLTDGTCYRECENGVLGIIYDNCWASPPFNFSYPLSALSLTIGVPFISPLPSVIGLNILYSIEPPLPAGLKLHPYTGCISGTPQELVDVREYSIHARNEAGEAEFRMLLSIHKKLCMATAELPLSEDGTIISIVCTKKFRIKGKQVYACENEQWRFVEYDCDINWVVFVAILVFLIGLICCVLAVFVVRKNKHKKNIIIVEMKVM